MKLINAREKVVIPNGVEVTIDKRFVQVKGPRGELSRSFRNVGLDIFKSDDGKSVLVETWFGKKKKTAVVRSVASHISNLITGVTKGFKYKMRFVYAHFPINTSVSNDKKSIEIRNFLGEKLVRRVVMLEGVSVDATGNKDEIMVYGNDISKVSLSAALIHQAVLVKDKDIRKFLDGIYVSEKEHITE